MVIWRVPVPRSVVAEPDVNTPRPIVAGHEPPNIRVEIPARLDEHVVHPLDDAVTIDPKVLAISVGPIAVDPDRSRALHLGLHDHDRLRRRRRLLRSRQRLRLLDDDHRVAIDDLRGAVLGLDDHVCRGIGFCAGLLVSLVSVVRDIKPSAGWLAVSVCAVVIGSRRCGQRDRRAKCYEQRKTNEGIHSSYSMCMSVSACRHPSDTEQARPARQSAWKVLGFWQF